MSSIFPRFKNVPYTFFVDKFFAVIMQRIQDGWLFWAYCQNVDPRKKKMHEWMNKVSFS